MKNVSAIVLLNRKIKDAEEAMNRMKEKESAILRSGNAYLFEDNLKLIRDCFAKNQYKKQALVEVRAELTRISKSNSKLTLVS